MMGCLIGVWWGRGCGIGIGIGGGGGVGVRLGRLGGMEVGEEEVDMGRGIKRGMGIRLGMGMATEWGMEAEGKERWGREGGRGGIVRLVRRKRGRDRECRFLSLRLYRGGPSERNKKRKPGRGGEEEGKGGKVRAKRTGRGTEKARAKRENGRRSFLGD